MVGPCCTRAGHAEERAVLRGTAEPQGRRGISKVWCSMRQACLAGCHWLELRTLHGVTNGHPRLLDAAPVQLQSLHLSFLARAYHPYADESTVG